MLGASVERFFLGVFGMEWLMRLMLYYQLEYSYNYEQIFGLFPPPDEVQWTRVVQILPEFVDPRRDPWVLLDFFLVAIAAIDELMTYLYPDLGDLKLNHAMILRVFRVFRLFRLVRVLRLMRTLKLLVDGMMISSRILVYALILLGLALFIFTVVAFELMKDLDGSETYRLEEMPEYFSSLWRGLLTMFQITTFAGWTELYREVTAVHGLWAKVLVIAVLSVAGLGTMNLVVGVMVESAFRLSRRERDKHVDQSLVPLRIKLKELGTVGVAVKTSRSLGSLLAEHNLGSLAKYKKKCTHFCKKWKKKCCWCCHRTTKEEKKAKMEQLHKEADLSDAWLKISQISEAMNYEGDLFDPVKMYQMEVHLALREVDLDWKGLWTTLSKLDCEQSGKVRLNEVMDCLARSRRDPDGLDVAQSRGTFRRMTRKARALDYMSEDLGNAIKAVMHRFADRQDVAKRKAAKEELLERRRYLAEYMGIDMDAMPKDTTTLRFLLRSKVALEGGDPFASVGAPATRDAHVSLNMEDVNEQIRFESEESRTNRTAKEATRRLFAMEDH